LPRHTPHSPRRADGSWTYVVERQRGKDEFLQALALAAEAALTRTYNLAGLRGDVDFMIWQVSEELEVFQRVATQFQNTGLGRYLRVPYSYLSQTRRSIYISQHQHEGQEGSRTHIRPYGSKYLFVYPFVKTRAWYALSFERRQAMMSEHFKIGHNYPSVRIHTTYSFGLDDQEFVLSFESDSPSDFLDLVMELRETEASSYTLRDTPTFSCVAMSPAEILEAL